MFIRSLALTFLLLMASGLPAITSEGLLRPIHLRCEYRKNPLGIDTLQPRLGWTLEPADPKARGQMQKAYQILAASSEESLRGNQGDLWDTRRVESNRSIQVPYDGKRLSSGVQVWWKVRVWGNTGSHPPGVSMPFGQWGYSKPRIGKGSGSDSMAARGSQRS